MYYVAFGHMIISMWSSQVIAYYLLTLYLISRTEAIPSKND